MKSESKVVENALDIMRKCFGGTEVELLEDLNYSNQIKIKINGSLPHKKILQLKHDMCEFICIYGESVANNIIFDIEHRDYLNKIIKKYDLNKKIKKVKNVKQPK